MKQFAKSLVSVVIALSILATMCIVGISVSAKVHEFVLVSETETKNKTDLKATKDGGVTVGTVDVVNTSTLGTPPTGAPETAYKFTIANAKDGVHFTAKSDDASALKGKTTELVFDAWVYVSDASKCGLFLFRMYGSAGPQAGGNGNVEGYVWQGGTDLKIKTGWNHVQVPMTFTNGWQTGSPATALNAYKADMKITGISLHDHTLASGNSYDVAVASIKLTYDDGKPDVDESEIADFAPADKDAGDYLPTKADKAVVSVVDVSTLTGGKYEGINETAYKVDFSEGAVRKEGVYTSLETPVRMKSAGAEKDYTFEAWVWAEKEVNDYIFQFYGDNLEKDTAVGDNHTEKWIYRISNDSNDTTKCITLKAGWNHIKVTLDSTFAQLGSGGNEFVKAAYTSYTTNQLITGFSIHDNADNATPKRISIAIADAKLYKTSAYKEPIKDTREYLISAKEDENMATGKWEAAEYLNTDNGAYGGTGVVRAQKNLDGVDITGKQITLWLYAEDPTKVTQVDVELTSGGACDKNELCFRFASTDLKKGWNKYILDYSIARAASANGVFGKQHIDAGGATDLTKINYIRIFGTENTEIKVGAMYFTDSEMGEGSATGDAVNVAMVVVAILLAAMAASVTVYFGKKAR